MSKCSAAQAVAEMEYWIGYFEKASGSYATTADKSAFEKNKGSSNYTYFGYICGVQGQPWCAATVSTVILRACGGSKADAKAVLHGVWPYTVCNQVWDAAPDNMKFWGDYQRFTLGKGTRTRYTPRAGDIIVFTDDKVTRSHTGMVYAADDKYVYTIEGNSGNMCRKRSYLRTSSYIYGYIRPNYAASSAAATTTIEQYGAVCCKDPELHVLSKGTAGPEVKTMQLLLIARGFSCGDTGADGSFGPATADALYKWQATIWSNPDAICGAKSWPRLLKDPYAA